MYYLYILKSLKDGKLYTGITKHLEKRLAEHNSGKSPATQRRRPFILVHSEYFKTKSNASRREYYLKSKKGSFDKFQIWQRFEASQRMGNEGE